jgi:hypothetical protein
MSGWDWLEKHQHTWGFMIRVAIKGLALFALVNLLFALAQPMSAIGKLTIHNWLLPGRERLPYGESPDANNLSMNNIDAMFAVHEVAQSKGEDEFRVFVMGDSSVWGILLESDETLAGYLDSMGLEIDGRTVRAYNLGHPILSLTKDLMLLDYAMRYDPDLIIWPVTLQSFAYVDQLDPPIVQNNADRVRDLIRAYDLNLDPDDERFVDVEGFDRTLIGQRRALANWLRLQLFGIAWTTSGVDQVIGDFDPVSNNLEDDLSYKTFDEPQIFEQDDLAFDVLIAGVQRADEVPVLIVNEPIYIADGDNSDTRYNVWYPQWAYDNYRDTLAEIATDRDWFYLDLWDAIAPEEFTDSPVHLTPAGSRQLADEIAAVMLDLIEDEEI